MASTTSKTSYPRYYQNHSQRNNNMILIKASRRRKVSRLGVFDPPSDDRFSSSSSSSSCPCPTSNTSSVAFKPPHPHNNNSNNTLERRRLITFAILTVVSIHVILLQMHMLNGYTNHANNNYYHRNDPAVFSKKQGSWSKSTTNRPERMTAAAGAGDSSSLVQPQQQQRSLRHRRVISREEQQKQEHKEHHQQNDGKRLDREPRNIHDEEQQHKTAITTSKHEASQLKRIPANEEGKEAATTKTRRKQTAIGRQAEHQPALVEVPVVENLDSNHDPHKDHGNVDDKEQSIVENQPPMSILSLSNTTVTTTDDPTDSKEQGMIAAASKASSTSEQGNHLAQPLLLHRNHTSHDLRVGLETKSNHTPTKNASLSIVVPASALPLSPSLGPKNDENEHNQTETMNPSIYSTNQDEENNRGEGGIRDEETSPDPQAAPIELQDYVQSAPLPTNGNLFDGNDSTAANLNHTNTIMEESKVDPVLNNSTNDNGHAKGPISTLATPNETERNTPNDATTETDQTNPIPVLKESRDDKPTTMVNLAAITAANTTQLLLANKTFSETKKATKAMTKQPAKMNHRNKKKESPSLTQSHSGNTKDDDGQTQVSTANTSINVLDNPWIHQRSDHFDSWFVDAGDLATTTKTYKRLRAAADADGPILDFVVTGFAKCGTTTVIANLAAQFAPLPVADVCTPLPQTVYYAYKNWPNQYGNASDNGKAIASLVQGNQTNSNGSNGTDVNSTALMTNNTSSSASIQSHSNVSSKSLLLRGSKCPRQIHDARDLGRHLPKTKLIVGIRHPVWWFQSFWNMKVRGYEKYLKISPYNLTTPCKSRRQNRCPDLCPPNQPFCVHRSQFHIFLAQLGKTAMTQEERKWLAQKYDYGGDAVENHEVPNPIFLYEVAQLPLDETWDGLAQFLELPGGTMDHALKRGGRGPWKRWGRKGQIDICEPLYDDLRAQLLEISYELSVWLLDYLVPVARDPRRSDVVIANVARFTEIVQGYREDPCHRLIRDSDDGQFRLSPDPILGMKNMTASM